MDSRKAFVTLLLSLLGIGAIWFLRQLPATPYEDETVDYKELYRDGFHTQAADMEARMKKRWNDYDAAN